MQDAKTQIAGLEAVLTEIMDGRCAAARKREIGKHQSFLVVHTYSVPRSFWKEQGQHSYIVRQEIEFINCRPSSPFFLGGGVAIMPLCSFPVHGSLQHVLSLRHPAGSAIKSVVTA